MSWFTASVDVARIAGAVGVAITIWEGTKAWWADGPGRRKHWTNSYRKIACGVQAKYVESLFGIPPFKHQLADYELRRTWLLGREGLLTVDTVNETVTSYSLTTTDPKFAPLVAFFSEDAHRADVMVKLGVSTFAEVAPEGAVFNDLGTGPGRAFYCELYHGGAQHWILANHPLGTRPVPESPHFLSFQDEFDAHQAAAPIGHRFYQGWAPVDNDGDPGFQGFRRTAVVNTVTITDLAEPWPNIGADTVVRLLAPAPTWRERAKGTAKAGARRVRNLGRRRRSRNADPTPDES